MRKTLRNMIVASTALAGLGVPAFAATPATGDPTATHGTVAMTAQANMGETIDERIASLHTKLNITSAQTPQWDHFAQVMRENAKSMDDVFKVRAAAMSGMTAEDNMNSYVKVAARHAENMRKLAPAFDALYDAMSDSQKLVADQVFRDNANKPRRG